MCMHASGYYEAKNFLTSLVYDKQVHLDIDDVYETDKYDRLVCVVYVSYNATHFKNVNKALLVEGYAVIWNFNNEFDPYAWTLYGPKEESPEPFLPTSEVYIIAIAVTVISAIIVSVLYKTRRVSAKPSSSS